MRTLLDVFVTNSTLSTTRNIDSSHPIVQLITLPLLESNYDILINIINSNRPYEEYDFGKSNVFY